MGALDPPAIPDSQLGPAFPGEDRVRIWLTHIGEDDAGTIEEVLGKCRADPEALAYYLRRADEIALPPWERPEATFDPGLRSCTKCLNLSDEGYCRAVRAGDLTAAKLVLDKLIANPKPADRGGVSLPELATARLEDIPTLLVRAVGEGRLSLDEAAQLAALVTAHARVIDQLLIESDIRARAAKTGQLAVLEPKRGYVTRPLDDAEVA